MWRRILPFLLLVTLIPSLAFANGWESLGDIDGVKVRKKEVEGTDLFMFSGEIVTDIHIGKIISVFADSNERQHWVSRYEEHQTLKKGENFEEYRIEFHTPFPVTNRDYVLRSVGSVEPSKREFTCKIQSVVRAAAPENDCCVRANANGTFYRFTAIPGPKPRTRLYVEVHTDPKGMLPDWLVNMIQKKWPSETLNGLIARAKESDAPIHPKFADWHDDTLAARE